MADDDEPKTIEHDPSPYNWYITDHYDVIGAIFMVAAFVYWRAEIKAIADWLAGNG